MHLCNREAILALSKEEFLFVKSVNLFGDVGQDINFILEYICEKFVNLEELIITDSELSIVPENICYLNKLKRLWLNKNNIKFLPDKFGELITLEELELEKTQIANLPKTIANLQNLNIVSFCKSIYENNNCLIDNNNMLVIKWNNNIIVPNHITHLNILNCNNVTLNNLPITVKHLKITGVDKPLLNLPCCLQTLNLDDVKNIEMSDIRLPFDCDYIGQKLPQCN